MVAAFGSVALALVSTVAILLLAAELGFHPGRRHREASDDQLRSQISMVEGALLGLLRLLLGFMFSMAVGRYDPRPDLVIREANALGGVLMHCNLLPSAALAEAKMKLPDYADARLGFVAAEMDDAKLAAVSQKTARLQAEHWVGGGDC